jgi:hypothetical protein
MKKKESGHQGRKRRRSEAARRRSDEAKRKRLAGESHYRDLPPPPENPVDAVAWANRVGALMLYEIINDPVLDAPTRWRLGSELIAKIGLTSGKAHTSRRLQELKALIKNPPPPAATPVEGMVLAGPGRALRAASKDFLTRSSTVPSPTAES